MLSFLVSELGYDFGWTRPRVTRSSVPETELCVGVVQVTSRGLQPRALPLRSWTTRTPPQAERVGIGVAKRLALVQADIWEKRGPAGDIYELEALVGAEETSTKSAIEKVVDKLAQQGRLLIRHNRGLKCTTSRKRKVKGRRKCRNLKVMKRGKSEADGEVGERVTQRAHETWR